MKKVLIITYYWPPAGGPGVQRVMKFAKYLPEFGWEPVILTVSNGEFPARDNSLSKDLPDHCIIYRTKSFEPLTIYRKLLVNGGTESIPTYVLNKSENESRIEKIAKWIRANIFIPDAKIGWLPFAVKAGLKIIKKENIELIFSSSPPQTVQLIAKLIAQKSKLKWIADFRDPWTEAFYQIDAPQIHQVKKLHRRLEKMILTKADGIIAVSDPIIDLFKQKVNTKYYLIPNGYDKTDFINRSKSRSKKFRVTFVGTLGKDQKIRNFLSALKNITPEYRSQLEVNFYGDTHPTVVKNIHEFDLNNIIRLNKYISHKRIIKKILDSELLLLVIPDVPFNEGIITGKLFEYLASGNFILGIGPENGDASAILKKTKAGRMFGYEENLEGIIIERLDKWKLGKKNKVIKFEIEKYSRKILTEKLSIIFNEHFDSPTPIQNDNIN